MRSACAWRWAPIVGCVAHGAEGRFFPGGHRIGDRYSRSDRRGKADDAAIIQRKALGSGDAGIGHVGVGLAALLASALPAWRAAGVEPMVALRNE